MHCIKISDTRVIRRDPDGAVLGEYRIAVSSYVLFRTKDGQSVIIERRPLESIERSAKRMQRVTGLLIDYTFRPVPSLGLEAYGSFDILVGVYDDA